MIKFLLKDKGIYQVLRFAKKERKRFNDHKINSLKKDFKNSLKYKSKKLLKIKKIKNYGKKNSS